MSISNVIIIDEMMGSGKSTSAINYINSSTEERFMVITPYLDEVERYKNSCPSKHFKEPLPKRGSKLIDIKDLVRKGYNIVSTHALFQRFDQEIIDLCKSLNYTLILDEVAEVVKEYDITPDDIKLLLSKYCITDSQGRLIWREDKQSYVGKFSDVKRLCNLGGLAIVRNKALMWLFPVEVFNAFKNIYILTYMFNAQIQRYYYDYYGINYKYMYISGDNINNYRFAETPQQKDIYEFNKLINIIDNYKLNIIGDPNWSLSKSWYDDYKGTAIIKQLQSNTINFFRNIRNDNTKDNIWTTFKDYKSAIAAKGYTRGFVPLNMRATNLYRDRTSVAYLVNVYLNPMVKGFFQDHGVSVDEDGYALSEMLQFIWRSAIRDGHEIWIYIPSARMRSLLEEWIAEVSAAE